MREATHDRARYGLYGLVSIHASHAGGDLISTVTTPVYVEFQSTPPMREATFSIDYFPSLTRERGTSKLTVGVSRFAVT